ncbi:hypothetical protein CDO52_13095 [Nocardiopsis gilva YIM 90087]|uniref:Uncharacterized protein n=1 Tax=Nocardiopsis gilva YIM 90087 TaxID=1235441 RepID=A0A223S648_9ACTN|nr:hypothetical protein [Nocardiopsis gilva]ASU83604.1 hypothetical protein CDO52_13095 [Nocardiopsis gilva YIM 90087]
MGRIELTDEQKTQIITWFEGLAPDEDDARAAFANALQELEKVNDVLVEAGIYQSRGAEGVGVLAKRARELEVHLEKAWKREHDLQAELARLKEVLAYAQREHLPLDEASVADALDDIQRERENRSGERHDG